MRGINICRRLQGLAENSASSRHPFSARLPSSRHASRALQTWACISAGGPLCLGTNEAAADDSRLSRASKQQVWRAFQGLGQRAKGLGFRVQGSGLRVEDVGLRTEGLRLRAQGLRLRAQGLGARLCRLLRASKHQVWRAPSASACKRVVQGDTPTHAHTRARAFTQTNGNSI